jgi:hypothetical protein
MNWSYRNIENQPRLPGTSALDKPNRLTGFLKTNDPEINARVAILENIPNWLQWGVVDLLKRAEADIVANDASARFHDITQQFVQEAA